MNNDLLGDGLGQSCLYLLQQWSPQKINPPAVVDPLSPSERRASLSDLVLKVTSGGPRLLFWGFHERILSPNSISVKYILTYNSPP